MLLWWWVEQDRANRALLPAQPISGAWEGLGLSSGIFFQGVLECSRGKITPCPSAGLASSDLMGGSLIQAGLALICNCSCVFPNCSLPRTGTFYKPSGSREWWLRVAGSQARPLSVVFAMGKGQISRSREFPGLCSVQTGAESFTVLAQKHFSLTEET